MNLRARMEQELNQLSSRDGSSGTLGFTLDLEHGQLECELAAIDKLACAVRRLAYRSGALREASPERLRKVAGEIADRIRYLLEPLALVELDEQEAVLQMRSAPPQRDGDTILYYELTAARGSLEFCRYKKKPRQTRRLGKTTLTREAFCRLAEDVAVAAESA